MLRTPPAHTSRENFFPAHFRSGLAIFCLSQMISCGPQWPTHPCTTMWFIQVYPYALLEILLLLGSVMRGRNSYCVILPATGHSSCWPVWLTEVGKHQIFWDMWDCPVKHTVHAQGMTIAAVSRTSLRIKGTDWLLCVFQAIFNLLNTSSLSFLFRAVDMATLPVFLEQLNSS